MGWSVNLDEVTSGKKRWKNEIFFVLILLLLCGTLFFFRLGARPLWNVDEGMHSVTSKEMVLSGDWITTTFNGENFFDKTVLHNWFVAISFLAFGFTEFAARLPAALLGLGCVMVTYLLGRRAAGPTVGLFGGVILATNLEFIIISRSVIHDISLVFFITLALYFFYMGFTEERRRKTYFFLLYGASGFAVLAKGPIGVLLPALIIALFLILQRKLSIVGEMHLGWGSLIFLTIAAPWYILISLRNSDYLGYFFIQQNLMRFLSPEAQHSEPFYYYFPVLLGGFFPWSFFLPVALFRALWDHSKRAGEGVLFLLVWFGVVFLFFSAASSKLSSYILPLFPAMSLLVGIFWHDLLKTPALVLRKGFFFSFIAFLAILLITALYFGLNPPTHWQHEYGLDMTIIYFLVFILLGCAATAFLLLLRQKYGSSFSTITCMMISIVILYVVQLAPLATPYWSSKELAQRLDPLLAPEEKLVFYRNMKDSTLFYTNRKAVVLYFPQQVGDLLASSTRAFVITDEEFLEELGSCINGSYVVDREGSTLVISNRKTDDLTAPQGDRSSWRGK